MLQSNLSAYNLNELPINYYAKKQSVGSLKRTKIQFNRFFATKKNKSAKSLELEDSATNVYLKNAASILTEEIIQIKKEADTNEYKDSIPLKSYSEYSAQTFLSYLKDDTPVAHATLCCNGELSINWRRENAIYTIVFTKNKKILWSYLMQGAEACGTCDCDYKNQTKIINEVHEIFGNDCRWTSQEL